MEIYPQRSDGTDGRWRFGESTVKKLLGDGNLDFVKDVFGKQAIYLIYKQDYEALTRMALNLELAEKIIADQPDKKRIVYAPACFLDEEYMEANQIEFVSIPYNLFQRKTS